MDFESILESPVVLVAGAVLVVAVAVFIFISGSKKDKQSLEKPENAATAIHQENTDSNSTETEKQSSFWKIKRNILAKIRSSKKPDVTGVSEPIVSKHNEMPPVREEANTVEFESEPDIDDIDDGADHTDMSDDTVEEMEIDEEDEIIGLEEAEDDVIEPDIEEYEDEETEVIEEPQETVQPEPEKPSSRSGDDIFSMFTDEEGEENEVSKFAKNLDPIDINDLVQKVDDIKRYIQK